MLHGAGGGPGPAWWAGSQLDFERLAAFGGMRQVGANQGGLWAGQLTSLIWFCFAHSFTCHSPFMRPNLCTAWYHLVPQVLRCYREAPTAEARRSMFAALYDYVVAGQVGLLGWFVGG